MTLPQYREVLLRAVAAANNRVHIFNARLYSPKEGCEDKEKAAIFFANGWFRCALKHAGEVK